MWEIAWKGLTIILKDLWRVSDNSVRLKTICNCLLSCAKFSICFLNIFWKVLECVNYSPSVSDKLNVTNLGYNWFSKMDANGIGIFQSITIFSSMVKTGSIIDFDVLGT